MDTQEARSFMPKYSVLPSNLDIEFIRGDEFGCLLDFDQDLTGYTFSAPVYVVASVRAGVFTAGTTFLNFTITNVDLAAGKVNLSLTETQTQSFTPGTSYRWYLRWVAPGGVTRTPLSGSLVAGDA